MVFSQVNQDDVDKIRALFVKTFTDAENASEGNLTGDLVNELMTGTDPGDRYGFAARQDDTIMGCVFFSRMTFPNDLPAFLLSPVAVHTDFQGRGIGQQLINFGIDYLKQQAVTLVMTYGDPAFYAKTGFIPVDQEIIQPPFELSQPQGWLARPLDHGGIQPVEGKAHCVPAFNRPELW